MSANASLPTMAAAYASLDEVAAENRELRRKLADAKAEDDAKAHTIGELAAELELRTGQLIAARDDLASLRNQLEMARTERDSLRAAAPRGLL